MPFLDDEDDDIESQQPIDARNIFIGRDNEINFFKENILKPRKPSHNILWVSGQGGIGKSILLSHFIEKAQRSGFVTGLVDERVGSPTEVLNNFAAQLKECSKFDTFNKAVADHERSQYRLVIGQEQ